MAPPSKKTKPFSHPTWKGNGGFIEPANEKDVVGVCSARWEDETGEERTCSWKASHYNHDLFAKHIFSHRAELPEEVEEFERALKSYKEKKEEAKAGKLSQPSVASFFKGSKQGKYDAKISAEKQEIESCERGLAAMVMGCVHMSYNMTENPFFRYFCLQMNPRFEVPSRHKTAKITNFLTEGFVTYLKRRVDEVSDLKKFIIGLDLWTSVTGCPFIGIYIFYFENGSASMTKILIAFRPCPYPHTAKRIMEVTTQILEEFGIDEGKIFKFLSDCASNLVKGFREDIISIWTERRVEEQMQLEELEDVRELSGYLGALNDEDEEDELDTRLAEEHDDDKEEPDAQEEIDFSEKVEAKNRKLVLDYEQAETEMLDLLGNLHFPCFDHRLNLVVQDALKKNVGINRFILRIRFFIRQIRKRKAGEDLKKVFNGKSLTLDQATRWGSTKRCLSRLNDAKELLPNILFRHKIKNLGPQDWDRVTELVDLLDPFSEFTFSMQSSSSPTLSKTRVAYSVLKRSLAKANPKTAVGKTLKKALDSGLTSRFALWIDGNSPGFDGVVLAATLLDPRFRILLTNSEKDWAKEWIEEELERRYPDEETDSAEDEERGEAEGDSSSPGIEPPSKQRVTDSLLEEMLREKRASEKKRIHQLVIRNRATGERDSELGMAKRQLNSYMEHPPPEIGQNECPLIWWSETGRKDYGRLCDLATTLLAMPATTAAVEALFSTAGKILGKDRTSLSPKSLEKEVLWAVNSELALKYLDKQKGKIRKSSNSTSTIDRT